MQRGTPLHDLQALGGLETVHMVRRYAHFGAEHLAGYVASMTEPPRSVVTKSLRSPE